MRDRLFCCVGLTAMMVMGCTGPSSSRLPEPSKSAAAMAETGGARAPETAVRPDKGLAPDTGSKEVVPDTPLERRVLYYPNDKVYGAVPEGVEVVSFMTPDGMKLQAWYLPAPPGKPTLVYFHGNGGNLTSLGAQFEAFRKLELGVVAVDYRGLGKSEGEPSEQGLYLDGLAAYDFAAELTGSERLVVYGRSLGGGVASYVAVNRPCRALILESTFTSAREVARATHGRKAALLINAFDSRATLRGFEKPVLLMHGELDTTVPYRMAKEMHEMLPNSRLFTVKGANHNNLRAKAGESYGTEILEFLRGIEG